ncbi:MAG: hypothetical protein MZV65_53360 [Chromatiales bacterium]|nr:hypothetical protein [Chromatiales bacterium]
MGDLRPAPLSRAGVRPALAVGHSQVSELPQAGAITEEEAARHPESNVITRAVGTSEERILDLDVFDVQIGDIFLLCSDGLRQCHRQGDNGQGRLWAPAIWPRWPAV